MSAPGKLPEVFWLTRDELFTGELSSRIDIWAVRPVRTDLVGGGYAWLAPEHMDVDSEDTCLGDWSLGEARLEVGNGIPDTSRECVRKGNQVTERERPLS